MIDVNIIAYVNLIKCEILYLDNYPKAILSNHDLLFLHLDFNDICHAFQRNREKNNNYKKKEIFLSFSFSYADIIIRIIL